MPAKLSEIIHPSWAQVLAPVEPQIHAMGDMLRNEVANNRSYAPNGENVLRAFTYPFEDVKVLILGQDPYPTPGDAVGLSFSVHPTRPLPKSLINIYKELCSDIGCPTPENGDLSPWCNQGVMLLNRVLTVELGAGKAGSHAGRGWEAITEFAIKKLAERNKPLVSILWGRHAQSAKPFLGNTAVIESVHPSPLSAHRGFFGSKPFSRCNELLIQQGASPIDWSL